MNTYTNGIMIGILLCVGIAYDVVAYVTWGNEGTLSKAMQMIGLNWRIVIVAYGGLQAHFFSPQYPGFDWSWQAVTRELYPPLCGLLGWIAFRVAWPQGIQ